MGLFKSIFAWWDGPTWGTRLFTRLNGEEIGKDGEGNRYFRHIGKRGERRWVIYAGINEASRVPPEWHGWLHKTTDMLPDDTDRQVKPWQQPHRANATGTGQAWARPGALAASGRRETTTGDYEAWTPEN